MIFDAIHFLSWKLKYGAVNRLRITILGNSLLVLAYPRDKDDEFKPTEMMCGTLFYSTLSLLICKLARLDQLRIPYVRIELVCYPQTEKAL